MLSSEAIAFICLVFSLRLAWYTDSCSATSGPGCCRRQERLMLASTNGLRGKMLDSFSSTESRGSIPRTPWKYGTVCLSHSLYGRLTFDAISFAIMKPVLTFCILAFWGLIAEVQQEVLFQPNHGAKTPGMRVYLQKQTIPVPSLILVLRDTCLARMSFISLYNFSFSCSSRSLSTTLGEMRGARARVFETVVSTRVIWCSLIP